MEMFDPAHPGELLKEDYFEPLHLSITAVAKSLGVSRKTLSSLVNGRSGISPDMALRLSHAFNTTPQLWLNMQQQYDLWHAKQKFDPKGITVFHRSKKRKKAA